MRLKIFKDDIMPTLIEEIRRTGLKYFYTGEEYKRKYFIRGGYISTGSKELDNLLDYGIEPLRIYEFYGSAGTGKTILLHQIIANSFLEYKRKNAYYLDGEGNFNPHLIKKLLKYNENEEAIKQVIYARIRGLRHLEELIKKISNRRGEASIVVIDGFSDAVRRDFSKSDPGILHSYNRKILLDLHNLKEWMEIPIIITVKVYSLIQNVFSEAYEPYGGLAQQCMVNKLVHLTKEEEFYRAIDPYSLKPTAFFKITERGVSDL